MKILKNFLLHLINQIINTISKVNLLIKYLDLLLKNSTNSNEFYKIKNLPFNHSLSNINILSQESKPSLSLLREFDYQYMLDKIKSNLEIFHKEKLNNTSDTYDNKTRTNSNNDLIFPNSQNFNSNKNFKIIEKTFIIKINYKKEIEKSSDKIKNPNKSFEIKQREKSFVTNKWSNFQIDFSYIYFNEEKKIYEKKSDKINFIKFYESDSLLYILIPAISLIAIAYYTTYVSTNYRFVIPIMKEMKHLEEIKWWHGLAFLIFGSLCLTIIFYFLQYIKFIYSCIVIIYSSVCAFFTFNYLFKTKFIKREEEKNPQKNFNNFIENDNDNNSNQENEINEQKYCECNSSKKNKKNFEKYKNLENKNDNKIQQISIDEINEDENEAENDKINSFTEDNSENNNKKTCEICDKKLKKEKNSEKEKNSSLNFYMNPIYNYRNYKILVFFNKKVFSFSSTEDTNSFFYFTFKLRIYELVNLCLISIMIYFWILTQNWIINNILAFSLCFVILSIFTVRNFKICIILLSCIFLYDVFWVFFSQGIFQKNVMVEVAINLNVPIKFEVPVFFNTNPLRACTILGLGDIVLPGIIIKYCKSFDYLKLANGIKDHSNYFGFVMRIYLISVIAAFIMNFVFQHAQPVLFYIAPSFIFGLIYYSIKFNEFKEFMAGENFKQMQICVDEIVNTEFSKFEDKGNNRDNKNSHIELSEGKFENSNKEDSDVINEDNKGRFGNKKEKVNFNDKGFEVLDNEEN